MFVGRVVGMYPVKTISTHIHETPALLGIVVQSVKLGTGIVLGMRAGDDHVVIFQSRKSVVIAILVSDDVVLVTEFI